MAIICPQISPSCHLWRDALIIFEFGEDMWPDLASSEDAYRNGRDKMDVGDYDSAIMFFEESIAAFPHFKT